MERQNVALPDFSQTVFRERIHTLGSTAIITDRIRDRILTGELDALGSYQNVYFAIHIAHSMGNSGRAYVQEAYKGKWKSHGVHGGREGESVRDLNPGVLRRNECFVGDFYCCPFKSLPYLARYMFAAIDDLLERKKEVSKYPLDQRLLLLVAIDGILTIGHFVKNASGRTNEDFLVFLAHALGIPHFSLSSSGFRGQVGGGLEDQAERSRWEIRRDVTRDALTAFFRTLSFPEVATYAKELREESPENFVSEFVGELSMNNIDVTKLCLRYVKTSEKRAAKLLVSAAGYLHSEVFRNKAMELLQDIDALSLKCSKKDILAIIKSSSFFWSQYTTFKAAPSL